MKPILFRKGLAEAILEGRKTQTRRVVKNIPEWTKRVEMHHDYTWVAYQDTMGQSIGKCPYGEIGSELWVKQGLYMPQKDAKIFLQITNVRIERVQDITTKEALAEGMWNSLASAPALTLIALFRHTWNDINKKRGFGWDVNPWVWVISFKKI